MIELSGIYTIRDTMQPYYWDIVFEWENELSNALHIPLIEVGKEYDAIYKPSFGRKILNRINFYQQKDKYFLSPSNYYLAFHIGPPGVYSFHSRKNVIPIIIDFWKNENLRRLESIFSLNESVFVTSREVYNYLVTEKIKININHLALSLPDKMFSWPGNVEKQFDLIQPGRQNDTLSHYVKLLLEEFPDINYVYGEKINGKMHMVSTINGNLGEFKDRESFLNLLRRTKISLLSAPGLDADVERTGGFSPVTPRFLESAACGCHLICLYPENDDFVYYGIPQLGESVKDYENFKYKVLTYLSDPRIPDHREFLREHLTSKRAVELRKKLPSQHAKR